MQKRFRKTESVPDLEGKKLSAPCYELVTTIPKSSWMQVHDIFRFPIAVGQVEYRELLKMRGGGTQRSCDAQTMALQQIPKMEMTWVTAAQKIHTISESAVIIFGETVFWIDVGALGNPVCGKCRAGLRVPCLPSFAINRNAHTPLKVFILRRISCTKKLFLKKLLEDLCCSFKVRRLHKHFPNSREIGEIN